MQVSDETKQNIKELTLLYEECLTAASTIPTTIIGEVLAKRVTVTKEFILTREDYRQIASSIFIELNKQKGRQRNQARTETELSTNKQQAFIGGLATKLGKKGENIIAQFLDNNEVKLVDKLSKAQATTLINLLQEAQNG